MGSGTKQKSAMLSLFNLSGIWLSIVSSFPNFEESDPGRLEKNRLLLSMRGWLQKRSAYNSQTMIATVAKRIKNKETLNFLKHTYTLIVIKD